jgi:hypothetical protein
VLIALSQAGGLIGGDWIIRVLTSSMD